MSTEMTDHPTHKLTHLDSGSQKHGQGAVGRPTAYIYSHLEVTVSTINTIWNTHVGIK